MHTHVVRVKQRMSMEASLTELYSKLLDKSIDSKTLGYWVSAMKKGNVTLQDFKASVIRSDEYTNRVESLFKQQYFELVGFEGVMDALQEYNNTREQYEPVSFESIGRHIKNSEAYSRKIEDMIQATYASVAHGNRAPPEVVNEYMARFKRDACYSMEDLTRDLQTAVALVNNVPSALPVQHAHVDEQLTKSPIVITRQPVLDETRLKAFEAVFNRPMYVKEYFKYVVDASGELNEDVFRDLSGLKAHYDSVYNSARTLHKNYTGCDLVEWRFVDKYLDRIEDNEFLSDFVNDIVVSPKYQEAMSEMINVWNSKLYDTTLDANDIWHLFEKVRNKKIHLYDDALVDAVKSFNMETETYIENLMSIFDQVLGREPEIQEIGAFIEKYRMEANSIGIDGVNRLVANKLIQSLEFHDVVKGLIKAAGGSVITTSKLYDALNQVLKHIGDDTTLEDVQALIKLLV